MSWWPVEGIVSFVLQGYSESQGGLFQVLPQTHGTGDAAVVQTVL